MVRLKIQFLETIIAVFFSFCYYLLFLFCHNADRSIKTRTSDNFENLKFKNSSIFKFVQVLLFFKQSLFYTIFHRA